MCGRKEPGKIASGCRSGASIPLRTEAPPGSSHSSVPGPSRKANALKVLVLDQPVMH